MKIRLAIGWVVLGGAAFAFVNLGQLPGDFGESLCGVWG
jgi:hypothetical protein